MFERLRIRFENTRPIPDSAAERSGGTAQCASPSPSGRLIRYFHLESRATRRGHERLRSPFRLPLDLKRCWADHTLPEASAARLWQSMTLPWLFVSSCFILPARAYGSLNRRALRAIALSLPLCGRFVLRRGILPAYAWLVKVPCFLLSSASCSPIATRHVAPSRFGSSASCMATA